MISGTSLGSTQIWNTSNRILLQQIDRPSSSLSKNILLDANLTSLSPDPVTSLFITQANPMTRLKSDDSDDDAETEKHESETRNMLLSHILDDSVYQWVSASC